MLLNLFTKEGKDVLIISKSIKNVFIGNLTKKCWDEISHLEPVNVQHITESWGYLLLPTEIISIPTGQNFASWQVNSLSMGALTHSKNKMNKAQVLTTSE